MTLRRLAAAVVVAVGLAGAAAADPRIDYMLQCRGCHGPDGQGAPGAAPSLRRLGDLLAAPGGRAYLVSVPGVSRSELDDAATASLLNWVLATFSPGDVPADFAPFTAAEVSTHRRPALTDPVAARRALVLPPAAQP
ncbi:MAG: cytochrome c [bacterium]